MDMDMMERNESYALNEFGGFENGLRMRVGVIFLVFRIPPTKPIIILMLLRLLLSL